MLLVQDVSGLSKPRTASVSPPVFHECLIPCTCSSLSLLSLPSHFHRNIISLFHFMFYSSFRGIWVDFLCETVNMFLHIYALQSVYTGCVVKQHVNKATAALLFCQCLQNVFRHNVESKQERQVRGTHLTPVKPTLNVIWVWHQV